MSIDPTTAEWLDGPGLAAWIDGHHLHGVSERLGAHLRRLNDWRSGATANVYTADIVLTKFELHLSNLPDDVWREAKKVAVAK